MTSFILTYIMDIIAVRLIALLAKFKSFFISQLRLFFLISTPIAHDVIDTRANNYLRATTLFGLFSLIPYAIYLITTLIWFIVAIVLLAFWQFFY